ncbi:hypothetical protein Tco_0165000, partial [Tanacetum coccineum]
MLDSEDSIVTYTEVSSPFEDLLDIGFPGVDGLPMMPEDPYTYVVAALQAPPSPDYVPAEEQPLPVVVSPTTDSPGYIAESDPKEDEKDPEEDPTDYPADGGDDDDDNDESSNDDEDDDDVDVEEDEDEEEEEHPALADSIPPPVIVLLLGCLFESSLLHHFGLSQRLPDFLHSITSTITISPSSSPPPPIPPPPLPVSPIYPLGYRAAMIQLRVETSSTSHPLP